MPGVSERATGLRSLTLLAVVVVALIVSFVPAFIGWVERPAGNRYSAFAGQGAAEFDGVVNASWMHEAARGNLPFRDLFTAGAPQPAVVSLLWFWFGIVGHLLHLPDELAVQLFRVLGVVASIVFVAGLAHFFRGPRGKPIFRFCFVALASGVGLYALAYQFLTHTLTDRNLPLDVGVEETTVLRTLLGTPHHMAALVLILASIIAFTVALEQRRTWMALVAGAALGVLATSVPYTLPVLLVVFPLATAMAFLLGFVPWSFGLRAVAAVIVGALPGVLLQVLPLFGSTVAAYRYAQNVHLLPSVPAMLVTVGFLLPLAMVGAVLRLQRPSVRSVVLVTWWVIHTAMLFAPLPFQKRMVQGALLPYAILAFDAVAYLGERWIYRGIRSGIALAFLVLAVGTSTPFAVQLKVWDTRVAPRRYFAYTPPAMTDALSWIRSNTAPTDAFFGDPFALALVAAYTERPVFVAHPVETPEFRARYEAYKELKDSQDGYAAARFLRQQGMRYAFGDERIDTLAKDLFPRLPNARTVFQSGPITIVALP